MPNIFKNLKFKFHCENLAAKQIGRFLCRSSAQIILFIIGLSFISFAVVHLRNFLNWLSNLHWLVGLIVAAGIIAGLTWLIHWNKSADLTRQNFGLYPKLGLALNLVFAVLAAMISMAVISDVLYRQQLVNYASNAPITAARFLDFYGWHFIDSIPFLKVWEVFEVQPCISSQDFGARALVQMFRVLIVASAIQVFLKKKATFRDLLTAAQSYRKRHAYMRAEDALRTANKRAGQIANTMGQVDAQLEYARLCADLARFCIVQAPGPPEKYRHKREKHLKMRNEHIEAVKRNLAAAKRLIDKVERERDLETRRIAIKEIETKMASTGTW